MKMLNHILGVILMMVYSVNSHQQYFRVKPKDTEIVEGHSSDLQCHIGNQAGAVQWSKDGFVLGFDADIPGYPRYNMIVDERRGVYNLRLKGVQLDDEGEYQCQVGPAAKNHPIRAASRVTVLVPPKGVEIINYANGTTLEVKEADRITLTCNTNHSKPAAKLKWYRNGMLLQGGSFHPREETSGVRVHTTLSSITVYVIMDDNGATYTCEAIHKALPHPLRAKITINVLYPPGVPEIEGYQDGDVVQVGDTLTLACITRGGNPAAELMWYRDNVQVDSTYSTSGREVTNIHTFTVDSTHNNAIYRCEASNTVTYHPKIAKVKLSVRFAPSKITILGPTEGKVGNAISISCAAGPSNPPSRLTWMVDGKSVEEADSAVNISKGGWMTSSTVNITLTRQDPNNKTISCYAESEALNDAIKETLHFSVVYPPNPPSIMGYEEGSPIRSGEFQRFTCVAIGGNPLATLRWYKRDREVRATSTVSGSGVFSELVIRADASDNGAIYRCEATNSATEKALVASITLTIHFPPSSVTIKINPNRPRAGEIVIITCESGSSNPQSTLHWWRNGEVLSNYESETNDALYGGKTTHSRLQLTATPKDDEAIFTCQATNHVLERSIHDGVTLRVLFKPEFQVPSLEKFDVVEGETIIVNLTARANPTLITYHWKKVITKADLDESSIMIPSKNDIKHGSSSIIRVSSKGALLEIKETKREDGGHYECDATNSEGSEVTRIVVNVLFAAVITSVTRSVVVSQGEDATFECSAIGNPMRSDVIVWRRSGFDMMRFTDQKLEFGKAFLVIQNVTRSHSGVFECVVSNGIGNEAVGRAQLIVKFKPELFTPRRSRKVAAGIGESVQLRCLSKGAPIVSFAWSVDGELIGNGSVKTIQIDEITWESILLLNHTKEKDYGEYTCTGKNEMGQDFIKIVLEGRGKPDPPESLNIINVTSDHVVISWSPGFDGGVDQHFRVKYHAKDSAESSTVSVVASNDSIYTINALKPGTEYYFAILAYNTLGESDYSNINASAHTLMSRVLPSTAVDALAKEEDAFSMFVMVVISVSGTLLLLINGVIVVFYMQRKRHKRTQSYPIKDNKGSGFVSSMYSRDKYHETINGEALRSPMNEEDGAFHEEILMKEIMKQDAEQDKIPNSNVCNSPGKRRWIESTVENNCPDILKNGHNYGKDGCETTSNALEPKFQDIHRDSLLDDRVPPDSAAVFYSQGTKGSADLPTTSILSQGPRALGVSTVDLSSGKTKTIVIHPTSSCHAQDPHLASLNCVTLDGNFL